MEVNLDQVAVLQNCVLDIFQDKQYGGECRFDSINIFPTQRQTSLQEQLILNNQIVKADQNPHSERLNQDSDLKMQNLPQTSPTLMSDRKIETLTETPRIHKKPSETELTALWRIDKQGRLVSNTLDISMIKLYFNSVASKVGMSVMRNQNNIYTVKVDKIDPIKCLFTMCLPIAEPDQSVYQLERTRIGDNVSRVEIVLISGSESKFNQFQKSFLYELWANGELYLEIPQIISLYCFANRGLYNQSTRQYLNAIQKYNINILQPQELQNWQLTLMANLKLAQQKLKSKIFSVSGCAMCFRQLPCGPCYHRVPKTKQNQNIVQKFLFDEVTAFQFYYKIQSQADIEFQLKKQAILTKFSVSEVFQLLQVDTRLLSREWWEADCQNKLLPFMQKSNNKWNFLPYSPAVQVFDSLDINASPNKNIQIISKFSSTLIRCFESNFIGSTQNPIMDMDNQLPLTIFCVLISRNKKIKPLITLLRDFLEQDEECQSQTRTIAAIKAAFDYVRLEWKL